MDKEANNSSSGPKRRTETWTPQVSDTWQIVLKNPIRLPSDGADFEPDVPVYDLDLFDNDIETIHEAKSLNMAIGLKNDGDILPDILDLVDFPVSEQCIEYSGCDTFAQASKPVFSIEYPPGTPDDASEDAQSEICSHQGNATATEGFSKVIKKLNLDVWIQYCYGKMYTTPTESWGSEK
ncbi:Pfam:DUF297 [Geosmithia morbida]|uniref:Pfam:DUF297 n=1 Tax=Geosmithia morbida TaxID=1094350 RepID=A0A9P4YSI5_9HYPO|nr:Pfam:DUF297 [Geosmithia morbida]KAF4121027.1 Pfam:DUF297 [Geosmithia morbida]